MAVDRRLDNVLRALLQPGHLDPTSAESSRVYASATNLLATLTNPLNVSLLSTQILVSPAIWQTHDGLRASLRTFGVFQSATLGKIETPGPVLGVEEWINALVRGANQNVPRWRHILLLGGVLSADYERAHLPRITRTSLEDAFCKAVNLSLETNLEDDLEADVLSLVLSHSIQSLSRRARSLINYDRLLPAVTKSIYHSREGFQSGYFLPTIDHDIMNIGGKISWPSKSNSFLELQHRTGRPLFGSMSRLARLAATAIRETREIRVLYVLLDSLERFSHIMLTQWKSNRLSEIPPTDEPDLVDEESAKATMPVVWQILKTVLFTTTMILQELTSRVIESPVLCDNFHGPVIARRVLHICRGFYFITSRLGPNAFSSYNFVYLAAIDIVTAHPRHVEAFAAEIAPAQLGAIPPKLPDQLLDLFFLNTTEHLVPSLSRSALESLLLPASAPYLSLPPPIPSSLRPQFESAHALHLAILSSPTPSAASLAGAILPFYTSAVLSSFPSSLSARQFRLAFSTLLRAASPPSTIAQYITFPGTSNGNGNGNGVGENAENGNGNGSANADTAGMAKEWGLADILLEMLASRAANAPQGTTLGKEVDEGAVGLGEKEVCVLAMCDALAVVEPHVLERWVDAIVEMVLDIRDPPASTLGTAPPPPPPPPPPSSTTTTTEDALAVTAPLAATTAESEKDTATTVVGVEGVLKRHSDGFDTTGGPGMVPRIGTAATSGGADERRRRVLERLWEVLCSELDVARAERAVRWWADGGREKMLGAGGGVGGGVVARL